MNSVENKGIYLETGHKERDKTISKLREDCELLIDKYGKVKKGKGLLFVSLQKLGKTLGLNKTISGVKTKEFSILLKKKDETLTISSSSENPKESEFIVIKGSKHMNELFLSKGDALILENWEMGESIHDPQYIMEPVVDNENVYNAFIERTNPYKAPLEEIEPYRNIVNNILIEYPLV